jgi:hypothetical protein
LTIEVSGVLNAQKQIEILDKPRLTPLKEAHQPGDVIRIVFSDEEEGLNAFASRKFHALRDEYADAMGYEKPYAKAVLKYRHGITLPYVDGFIPPIGQRGAFLEVEGKILWCKSVTAYTMHEWTILILGTEKDIAES